MLMNIITARPSLFQAIAFGISVAISAAAFGQGSKNPNVSDRLDVIGAKVHGQPPVGLNDLAGIEPACVLVLRYVKREQDNPQLGVWYEQLKGSPLLDLPQNHIAKGALSFHHYCWAEVVRNRYYRESDARIKKELAEYVVSSHKWMIDNAEYIPGDWRYLPKVYINMGTGYLLMKNTGGAFSAFQKALSLDPRQQAAYTNLADTFVTLGKKPEALGYIKEGLRYFPESKALKRRYEELGGKPPYPEPHPSAIAETPVATPAPDTVPPPPSVSSKEKAQAPEERDSAPKVTDNTRTESTNKNNPHCRFCAE